MFHPYVISIFVIVTEITISVISIPIVYPG